jgi:hypothetical protein
LPEIDLKTRAFEFVLGCSSTTIGDPTPQFYPKFCYTLRMTQLLNSVIAKVQQLPEAEQDELAAQWLATLEFSELQHLEQNRTLALSDFLDQLEPDRAAHQRWLEANHAAVKPAKYVIGQGLVFG